MNIDIDPIRSQPGRTVLDFDMRARAPLFDTASFNVVGRLAEGGALAELWAVTPAGTIAMQARARIAHTFESANQLNPARQ